MRNIKTEVAIIGGGPAGSAAAIQLKRAGIDLLLFEKRSLGGLAANANFIENYLGIPQGINGLDFVKLIEEQVSSLVIDTLFEEVLEVVYKDGYFILKTDKTVCNAKFLILATGTIPFQPTIVGIKKAEEKGMVFYEPNDIPQKMASNSKIAIIGGGDAAFDYALNLIQKDNTITIIHRNDNFKCLPLLYYRVTNIPDIVLKYPFTINEIRAKNEKKIELLLSDQSLLIFDLLLCATGRIPNNNLLVNLSDSLIDEKRLFLIGDLVNDSFRQISIAASDGLRTAMEIINEIKPQEENK